MAVLKVARQLQLVRELDAVQVPGHAAVPIPEALLQRAIGHANEGLLVDAMTLACVHPKTTAMPGARSAHPFLLFHACHLLYLADFEGARWVLKDVHMLDVLRPRASRLPFVLSML